MKKIYFVLILTCIGLNIQAQNGAVMKAQSYLSKGILDLAKENIDAASKDEKTGTKAKTFVLKGKIYTYIYISDNEKYKTLKDSAVEIAIQAFDKAASLESKKSTWQDSIKKERGRLYGNAINKGATAFQQNDYPAAEQHFKAASMVSPEDTTGFLYMGIAAQNSQDYEGTKYAFTNLLRLGYDKLDVYKQLVYIARAIDKDEAKALEIVTEARKKYPDDKTLAQEELNILIATNQLDLAKAKLEDAIKTDPNNASLYYNLGFMYDQSKNVEQATKFYEKAIELKPDYFEAYFNLGVMHYNTAAEILKEVNAMDLKTYNKVGKAKEAEGIKKLEVALPFFEKAHKLNADDAGVMETLSTIYDRLKRPADADRIRKELDAKR